MGGTLSGIQFLEQEAKDFQQNEAKRKEREAARQAAEKEREKKAKCVFVFAFVIALMSLWSAWFLGLLCCKHGCVLRARARLVSCHPVCEDTREGRLCVMRSNAI